MSNIIVKHRHGLVTDCHHLPMVPIVPQSAPMASVADVSVKLYFVVVAHNDSNNSSNGNNGLVRCGVG